MFRTRAEVFGPTKEEGLRIQLAQELSYLPDLIEGVAYACKALGEANRMKKPMRRFWQGRAMRGSTPSAPASAPAARRS